MVISNIEPLQYMLLNGLPNLAYQAWQELEHEHSEEPYSPDWEGYQRQESNDKLRFFSLREDHNLIGYASVIIDTDIHRNKVLYAEFRDIYIQENKRGHAAYFVSYIERFMSAIGVRRMYGAQRFNSPETLGKFYELMGYAPQETLWAKTLQMTIN